MKQYSQHALRSLIIVWAICIGIVSPSLWADLSTPIAETAVLSDSLGDYVELLDPDTFASSDHLYLPLIDHFAAVDVADSMNGLLHYAVSVRAPPGCSARS